MRQLTPPLLFTHCTALKAQCHSGLEGGERPHHLPRTHMFTSEGCWRRPALQKQVNSVILDMSEGGSWEAEEENAGRQQGGRREQRWGRAKGTITCITLLLCGHGASPVRRTLMFTRPGWFAGPPQTADGRQTDYRWWLHKNLNTSSPPWWHSCSLLCRNIKETDSALFHHTEFKLWSLKSVNAYSHDYVL